MVPRRWISSASPINGSSCIHDCYKSNHPPHPRSSSPGHRFFVNAFIAAVCAAAAVFFLVLTYYTILVRRRRTNPLPSGGHPPLEPDGAVADYHVWRAPTVGLNESTINSIPVKPYISGGRNTADCSVCLGEFRDGELIRLLPVCDHAFHSPCIDTWLRAHINCPLCRANIIDPADSGEGGLTSVAPEGNALTSDRRVSGDFEEDEGREIGTLIGADSSLDCGESSIFGESSDFPRCGLQAEWRSNSMDSLRETETVLGINRGEFLQEEKKELEQYYSDDMKKEKRGSSFKEDCQQKIFEEIGGGSSSESGRRFFFSKYGRARSSSVLPL